MNQRFRSPVFFTASSFIRSSFFRLSATRRLVAHGKVFHSCLAALPLVLGAANSVAQADTGERRGMLEEILVTASRREESLQEVAARIHRARSVALVCPTIC